MKRFFVSLLPMAIATVALVSCQKEIEPAQEKQEGPITITVKATPEGLANVADTKTYIGTYNNTANTILWGTGEFMKLAVTPTGGTTVWGNSTDASANQFNGEPTAFFEFSVSPEPAASYRYLGLYPASACVKNENPDNFKVILPATQSATATSYDPAAYIMVAKPESFTSVESSWNASFRRVTALNKITLRGIPEDIVSVEFTSAGKNLAGRAHIDLTSDDTSVSTVLDVYEGSASVKVNYDTAIAGESRDYKGSMVNCKDIWFTSWNVEIASGETLLIIAKSATKSYTRELTANSNGIKFKEGYLNTLSVDMSSATVQNLNDYSDYYLIGYKPSGAWILMNPNYGTNSYYPGYTTNVTTAVADVDFNNDFASISGISDYVWKVEAYDGAYSIKSMKSGEYLALTSNSNAANHADELGAYTKFSISISEKVATIESTAFSGRVLKYNSSSPRFAFYSSGQNAICLIPASYDNRTAVTLSFAESTISKTTANISEFTGQTATADPNLSAITGNITYAMEGDAIGTINASTGVVGLNGTEGSATVTASFAGDTDYRPATASYTISVSSAGGPQYELVTTVAGVTEGDYIITWNNAYYLPSGSTSGTNPAAGTGITVANDKIANTVTSNMVWTFTGDNTNGFTISDGTNILHSTNAAQGISITTNSPRKWTVSIDNQYGMLLHGNDGGTRYLAMFSSNQTWRYYTKGNDYSGTLRLYKLSDLRSDAGMSWSTTSASATINDGDVITFTAPTLTPGNATGITYNSTDTDVATISNTGVVAIVGGGTTTIQAIFAGDTNYKPATAEYELTVTDNRAPSYDFETVAELNALVTSTSASYSGYLTDAVVSFVPASNTAIIKDASGSVMVYKSNHGLSQGQTYTGAITVTAIKYNSLYSEITAWSGATFTGSQAVVAPETVTLSALSGHYDDYQNAYVQVTGLTVESISGKNINVTDGTNNYVVYDNPGTATCVAGDVITAVGTITKYQTTEELKVWAASDITITGSAPKAITFSQPASGGSFTVSVGGSTITSGTTVASGTTVTLTASPAQDYTFSNWSVSGATVADASAATTTFTMGTSAVTISATFNNTNIPSQDYTTVWTATSGALGSELGSGSISTTVSGGSTTQSWSYTRTLSSGTSYTGWTSECIQLGKNGGVENLVLSTSDIPGTIKSVSVECASYQGKHNVSISVGGTTYLASTATSTWTTVEAKSGTGTSSGEIVISFTGGTRALYIKSITVVYNN